MALKSPKPLMNAIAGELSLRIDRLRTTLELAEHIPGLLNFIADALSRLSQGVAMPEVLAQGVRFPAVIRDETFWSTWPQNWA